MTTTEILMLIFGSVGSGIVAASAVYGIMRRMEKWKREAEPISPIPNSEGRLCTSDRVGRIRGVMWGFIVLLGLMLALLILFFVFKYLNYAAAKEETEEALNAEMEFFKKEVETVINNKELDDMGKVGRIIELSNEGNVYATLLLNDLNKRMEEDE